MRNYSYPDIPNLYGETDHDPIKLFLVEKTFAYSALVSAVMDRQDIREGVLNTLDGPHTDGFHMKMNGFQFANDVARGRLPVVLQDGINVQGHSIALIDVVTYPIWHCLITGIDFCAKGNEGVLWKVNHNLLSPFRDALLRCGHLYTFHHFNEQPIDDAPTHNLLVFNLKNGERKAAIESAVNDLFRQVPNPNLVHEANPFMDARYCLNHRLPKDPPAQPISIMTREDVLLAE